MSEICCTHREIRNGNNFFRKPEGKVTPGKSRRKWKDNIKMNIIKIMLENKDWIQLGKDNFQRGFL
jgi:hypothetical protein